MWCYFRNCEKWIVKIVDLRFLGELQQKLVESLRNNQSNPSVHVCISVLGVLKLMWKMCVLFGFESKYRQCETGRAYIFPGIRENEKHIRCFSKWDTGEKPPTQELQLKSSIFRFQSFSNVERVRTHTPYTRRRSFQTNTFHLRSVILPPNLFDKSPSHYTLRRSKR